MLRIKNWCFTFALVVGLCGPMAKAQGTVNAASCNQTDVNAVINGPTHKAVNGDIINIPAGSCTWTAGIIVPSGIGISIIGSGTLNSTPATVGGGTVNTTITDDVTSGHLFFFRPTYGNSTTRLSTLNIQPYSGATLSNPIMIIGTCTSSGCPNMRVDNIAFSSSWTSANVNDATMVDTDNMFGVLDHNTVNGTGSNGIGLVNVNHSAWQGVGQYGDNSWASPDTFGTAQAVYIENNAINDGFADDTDGADTYEDTGGGRFVCRYNTFNGVSQSTACLNHGTETTGRPRGGRQTEAYNNSFICTNTSIGCGSGVGLRSGAALVYNNTYTAQTGSWFNSYAGVAAFRSYRGPAPPWGSCDGTGPWDQNDGTVYGSGTILTAGTGTFGISTAVLTINQWAGSAVTNGTPYSIHDVTQGFGDEITSNTATLYTFIGPPLSVGNSPLTWNTGDSFQILRATVCIDQPGRGQGALISGNPPAPTGWVNEALDPVYEWGDTHTGAFNHAPIVTSFTNRLLVNRDYYYQVSPSAQTSPTSPFNGTVGTGYGTLANRPVTCSPIVAYWATNQNTLYKCTTENTWTEFYQPYTYPHPLTAGTTAASVNPPQNLNAIVQ